MTSQVPQHPPMGHPEAGMYAPGSPQGMMPQQQQQMRGMMNPMMMMQQMMMMHKMMERFDWGGGGNKMSPNMRRISDDDRGGGGGGAMEPYRDDDAQSIASTVRRKAPKDDISQGSARSSRSQGGDGQAGLTRSQIRDLFTK